MTEKLETFTDGLLHLDDVRNNCMLNVAGADQKAFKLSCGEDSGARIIEVIKERTGKPSNGMVLKDSALVRTVAEAPAAEKWDWQSVSGERNPSRLDAFITSAYNDVNLKGNNPLYLGVGLLRWEVAQSDEIMTIETPLLIFPVKLVRGTKTSPVEVGFPNSEAYINPCLYKKLIKTLSESVWANFPRPETLGDGAEAPIDIEKLDGEYLKKVKEYIAVLAADGGKTEFDENAVVISTYNHTDICMYYDVRRNRARIEAHPLVRRVFAGEGEVGTETKESFRPRLILPHDSVQEELISRICAGESLIIKGPPGTGKTLTIANMIAALMARGKSVIFVSKKLSALAEVNAKLPERLRRFVMLLDYETEKKAAQVDPAVIKAHFRDMLRARREFTPEAAADNVYARSVKEKSAAITALDAYSADMYGSDIAGGSYYDALDKTLADVPAIDFAEPDEAYAVDHKTYLGLCAKIREAGESFLLMSRDGRIELCPWYGIDDKADSEKAFSAYSEICRAAERVTGKLGEVPEKLTLVNLIAALADNVLTEDEMSRLLACKAPCDFKELEKLINDYNAEAFDGEPDFDMEGSENVPAFKKLIVCGADESLTYNEIQLISAYSDVFVRGGKFSDNFPVAKLREIFEKISALRKEAEAYENDALLVFDKLDKESTDRVIKAYASLRSYRTEEKPRLFDFKAKSAYKSLCGLSSHATVGFSDAVNAAASCSAAAACLDEVLTLKRLVDRIAGRELNEGEVRCVKLIVEKFAHRSAEDTSLGDYLKSALTAWVKLGVCLKSSTAPDDFKLGDYIKAYKRHIAGLALSECVEKFDAAAGIDAGKRELSVLACSIALVLRTVDLFDDNARLVAFLSKVKSLDKNFGHDLLSIVRSLIKFGNDCFGNYYTKNPFALTMGELKIFANRAEDRALVAAAEKYRDILGGKNALPVGKFFKPFEDGEVCADIDGIVRIFEKSFYRHAVSGKLKQLGKRRNGFGKHAAACLDKYERAEERELEANAAVIENLCMSRITPDDADFSSFSADKGIKTSLRKFFKNNAAAILKLKKCIILSPSTASVLFGSEQYSNFDTLIIDEASQLDPVSILPVLFRTKQCVMVGDEYQMPPLTHFKAKNAARIADPESDLIPDRDISALSLALENSAFDAVELICHYRSRAESLICFSQRAFYPAMRTFPAADEFADGLGFKDVFVEGGRCDGGVNAMEAEIVVQRLKEHFGRYYAADTGVLSRSVGVVAFGEAQLSYILKLVEKDRELSANIERAKSVFDDIPEKLIFFATIESVQGQETEHLILSLTYGRDKDGELKRSFGELNRDEIGKCIFNVAVTRAQCMITVVHSVKPEELGDNPRIAFIKDYLKICRELSDGGKHACISEAPERGANFVNGVVEFLKAQGIDGERIVLNYGVTDGSVRIPVAVLSEDRARAVLGIWCEYPVDKKYDYIDYNVRYYRSLCTRGWNMHRISIHEWTDNARFEREALANAVANIK